jgi:hypothetical protein
MNIKVWLVGLVGLMSFVAQSAVAGTPSMGVWDAKALAYFMNTGKDGVKKHKECKQVKLKVGLPNYCVGNSPAGYVSKPGDGGWIEVNLHDVHKSTCGSSQHITFSAAISGRTAGDIVFYNAPTGTVDTFFLAATGSKDCFMEIGLRGANEETSFIQIKCDNDAVFYFNTEFVSITGANLTPDQITLFNNARLLCYQ